jgi:hypothetical protein
MVTCRQPASTFTAARYLINMSSLRSLGDDCACFVSESICKISRRTVDSRDKPLQLEEQFGGGGD